MKTVLIIDDEKDLCRLLTISLRKEKIHVDCAFSLADAKSKLLDHPSIVLLDNNLPDGLGLDFLRENPQAFKKSCVIMISADARPKLRKDAFREGIRVFLQMPFPVGVVKEVIFNLV
jgi:DNA-binding response OmpR family regulator